MKLTKYLLLALLPALVMPACDENNEVLDNQSMVQLVDNNKLTTIRSIEDVIKISDEAKAWIDGAESRVAHMGAESVIVLTNTKSRSNEPDTTLYVVNYENNSGYAVISARKDLPAVLAVTESGEFKSIDSFDNEGVKMFFNLAENYVSNTLPSSKIENNEPLPFKYWWTDTVVYADTKVEPRIKTKWGQTMSGNYCPNKISGCVPLAGAMAMSYIERPVNMSLTFPEKPQSSININWSNIKLGLDNSTLSMICREIGHQIGADYSDPNQTKAVFEYLQSYMKRYLGASSVGNINNRAPYVYTDLGDGIILMDGGRYDENNDVLRHTWIVDGYIYKEVHYYTYCQMVKTLNGKPMIDIYGNPVLYGEKELLNSSLEVDNYHHINWGWNGLNNGYFLSSVFNPDEGVIYDDINVNLNYTPYTINLRYFCVNK